MNGLAPAVIRRLIMSGDEAAVDASCSGVPPSRLLEHALMLAPLLISCKIFHNEKTCCA